MESEWPADSGRPGFLVLFPFSFGAAGKMGKTLYTAHLFVEFAKRLYESNMTSRVSRPGPQAYLFNNRPIFQPKSKVFGPGSRFVKMEQEANSGMFKGGYQIRDPQGIYFLTCTVVEWIDIFSRPIYADLVIESLKFCIREKGLQVHAWVLMSNHLHLIASAKEVTPAGFPVVTDVLGSEILVQGSGSRLSLSGSTFQAAGNEMWKGMRCEECDISIRPGSGNPVVIKDAFEGIRFVNSDEKQISVNYTTFQNCYYGLIVNSDLPNPSVGNRLIQNCTFISDPLQMKIPYHPRDLELETQQFLTRAGLVLTGNCSFMEVDHPSLGTIFPLDKLSFENCIFGVFIQNNNDGAKIDIHESSFKNIALASVYSNFGIRRVISCKFELPKLMPSYYNISNGDFPIRPFCYGIYSTSGLEVRNSDFGFGGYKQRGNGWRGIGCLLPSTNGNAASVSITANTFSDFSDAIFLGRLAGQTGLSEINFTLRCNQFNVSNQPSNPITRRGLVIGEGVRLRAPNDGSFVSDQIGGAAPYDETNTNVAYPNANVWPTATPRSTPRHILPNGQEGDLHDASNGWLDAPNWISIVNNTTNNIHYHRYDNEFVKNNLPQPNPNNILYPSSPRKIITGTINPDPNIFDLACANFTDPLANLFAARVAVVSGLPEDIVLGRKIFLSDPIPNPAQNETRVQINLPERTEKPILQLIELSTGRVLQNVALKEWGQQEVLFSLHGVPSGVYSYRLFLDGIPTGTKKLVVTK